MFYIAKISTTRLALEFRVSSIQRGNTQFYPGRSPPHTRGRRLTPIRSSMSNPSRAARKRGATTEVNSTTMSTFRPGQLAAVEASAFGLEFGGEVRKWNLDVEDDSITSKFPPGARVTAAASVFGNLTTHDVVQGTVREVDEYRRVVSPHDLLNRTISTMNHILTSRMWMP